MGGYGGVDDYLPVVRVGVVASLRQLRLVLTERGKDAPILDTVVCRLEPGDRADFAITLNTAYRLRDALMKLPEEGTL